MVKDYRSFLYSFGEQPYFSFELFIKGVDIFVAYSIGHVSYIGHKN